MTFAWTNVNLPPAFIGQPYEAALTGTGASIAVTAAAASGDTGLPPGVVINADGTRLTGTPTGALSTPNGTGVATQGEGVYTATLTNSAVTNRVTIYLYDSQTSPTLEINESAAAQAATRDGV